MRTFVFLSSSNLFNMASTKYNLSIEEVKDIVLDALIFLSPFIASNQEFVSKFLSSHIGDPTVSALILSFVLYVAKRFSQGVPREDISVTPTKND